MEGGMQARIGRRRAEGMRTEIKEPSVTFYLREVHTHWLLRHHIALTEICSMKVQCLRFVVMRDRLAHGTDIHEVAS